MALACNTPESAGVLLFISSFFYGKLCLIAMQGPCLLHTMAPLFGGPQVSSSQPAPEPRDGGETGGDGEGGRERGVGARWGV